MRMLSRDDRAISLLVHDGDRTHVARVFEPTADPAAVEQELAVLEQVTTAPPALRHHVVGLHDLFTLADGRVVALLEHVTGCALGDLLRRGAPTLALGEAVTVLAPLLQAVDAAHELGLVGLPTTAASIRFSATGAPVIVDVGSARPTPVLPTRFRAVEQGYLDDRRALHALTLRVASALSSADAAVLEAALTAGGAHPELLPTAAALFDLAAPMPIRLAERPVAPPLGEPDPVIVASVVDPPRAESDTADAPAGPAPGGLGRAIGASLRALALPAGVVEQAERVIAAAETGAARLRAMASGRMVLPRLRPRFLIAGVGGLGALLLATALAVGSADRPQASASGVAGPTDTESLRSAPPPSMPRTAVSDLPESLVHPEPDEWPGLVEELIHRWVACARAPAAESPVVAASSPCDRVAHAGSTALALLRSPDPRHDVLAQWVRGGGETVVVERMGGAVLVDLVASPEQTTAASLLLVRSEAGWRVRDVRL